MTFLNNDCARGKLTDQTESILNRHLDNDFQIFRMAETTVTEAQIHAIGERYGVKYPEEFVAHICGKFPGVLVEVKEEIWPRPKLHEICPAWTWLYAMYTYTCAPESELWMRLDAAAKSFQEETGLIAAPVLALSFDADVYCTTPDGSLVQYEHESDELVPVGLDFWQLFEREVAELKERKLLCLVGT